MMRIAEARRAVSAAFSWSLEHPDRRPSRFPFHELLNELMTPHCSAFTDGAADRRWGDLAANLDRFVRGEGLKNVVMKT
jgi:phosphoglycerate dehydrogenase-like enzyme